MAAVGRKEVNRPLLPVWTHPDRKQNRRGDRLKLLCNRRRPELGDVNGSAPRSDCTLFCLLYLFGALTGYLRSHSKRLGAKIKFNTGSHAQVTRYRALGMWKLAFRNTRSLPSLTWRTN